MTGQPLDDVPTAGDAPAEQSGPSDPELIRATRIGETSPFAVLQARHEDAVRRLARGLVQARAADADTADADPQDTAAAVDRLVTETFAGIHTSLQAGNGPDLAFRAHALTTARQVLADSGPAGPQSAVPPDTPARRALAALPERWQMALWHIEVDEESPEHVAVLLGMTAGAVVALTHRAHQRLRERYAAELLPDRADDACRRATAAVTGVADEEAAREAKAHRSNCESCRTTYEELAALRQDPAMTLAEALLGNAATAYLGRPRRRESGATSRQLARWGSAALTSLRRGARRVGPRRTVAGAAIVATAGVLAAVALVAMTATPSTAPPTAAPNPTDANADTTPSDASPPPSTGAPSASASPSKVPPSPSPSSASPSTSPPPPASPPPPPPPAPTPRLDIVSAGQRGDLIAGQTGALEVTVRNTGTRATALVQLRLRLPRGFALAAGEAGDGWSCAGSGDVTCTRTFLGVGVTTTATVYVRIDRHATGRHTVGVAVEAGSARDTSAFAVEVRRKGGGGH